MTADADAHSLLIGGSTASRRLNCPASFREQLIAPPGTSSTYADRGTDLHAVMAAAFRRMLGKGVLTGVQLSRLRMWAIKNMVSVDPEDVGAITAAFDRLDVMLLHIGERMKVLGVEITAPFPGVPGAFGTIDLVLGSAKSVLIVDWKFGTGVPVSAIERDEERGDKVNEQLMYYAACARKHSISWFYQIQKPRAIWLAIVQPAFEADDALVDITNVELNNFEEAVEYAVADALSTKPHRARGEWCRFAPCKATCPFWTGPVLDLALLDPNKAAMRASAAEVEPDDWGRYLAAAKRLVDSALAYKKLIDTMLMDHLRSGGKAPGFALKLQTPDRQWLEDQERVAAALRALGFEENEIWRPKQLQTFRAADAAAKRNKVQIPDELRPRPPATTYSLTDEGDPDKVDAPALTDQFRAALKALR